tara:strand:- start:6490 stop:6660 length:171 start_codon:yes stop_codon:yes gene_type:complete
MKKQNKSIHRNALYSKMMAPKIQPKPVIKEYLHDIRVRLRELRLRLNSLIRMTNES